MPVPVTVPAPDCLAKVMTVVLSEVTVFPAASCIVAVSTRVAPEVRFARRPGQRDLAAAPCVIVIEGEAPRLTKRAAVADDRCCACQVCAPAGPAAVAPGPPPAVEP